MVLPVWQEGGAVEPDEVEFGESPLVPDEGGVDVVDGADEVDLGSREVRYCTVLVVADERFKYI